MNRTSVDPSYAATRRELALGVPYERFTSALESLLGSMKVGSPDAISTTASPEMVREELSSSAGSSDFALFQTIDHGGLLSALGGRQTRAMTYVFGNGLVAVEMTKHVPAVGLYVPLRLFVREVEAGTAVNYDVPSTTLAQFSSPQVDVVATGLDAKVEKLIGNAAELAAHDAAA
jgi:uncharacterized protein (DUF302 family)